MEDLPFDVLVTDILCYIPVTYLFPISFTCKKWSEAVDQYGYRQQPKTRHLLYPCDTSDMVSWWTKELRRPCIEEVIKIAKLSGIDIIPLYHQLEYGCDVGKFHLQEIVENIILANSVANYVQFCVHFQRDAHKDFELVMKLGRIDILQHFGVHLGSYFDNLRTAVRNGTLPVLKYVLESHPRDWNNNNNFLKITKMELETESLRYIEFLRNILYSRPRNILRFEILRVLATSQPDWVSISCRCYTILVGYLSLFRNERSSHDSVYHRCAEHDNVLNDIDDMRWLLRYILEWDEKTANEKCHDDITLAGASSFYKTGWMVKSLRP